MLLKVKNPLLRIGIIGLIFLVSCFILFVLSVYFGLWGKLPSKASLTDFHYQRASEVYSTDSVLIGKYYLYDRQPIAYEEVSPQLISALIAIEDERFYDHSGIDYTSLFRVAVKTILMQDRSAGGGSTLTQQLVKNLYPREGNGALSLAATKFKEMIIASRLEDIHTKKELLMHYLNTVSFGDNTFGVESAALKFFNKRAKDLLVEESAVLVGMLKATYGYNPRIFPENSLKRRNLVLNAMVKNQYLDQEQGDSISQLPLKLDYRDYAHNDGIAPYFREEVRKQLLKWTKEQNEKGAEYNIYTSGLKIYTTLDLKMQTLAELAMREHMKPLQHSFEKSFGKKAPWETDQKLRRTLIQRSGTYKKLQAQHLTEQQIWDILQLKKEMNLRNWDGDSTVVASAADSILHYSKFLNMGSLSLDPATGAVKTWVGGIDFKYFKYDHISQSQRQVGSAFKPVVYTAALENGITPCTYFAAEEVVYENMQGWSPSNSSQEDEAYLNYSMKEALSKSVNTVAVKVLEKTGIPQVLAQAKKMGITTSLPQQPSLALGTAEIKINELAGAYASYLNQGRVVTPFLIHRIANEQDSTIALFEPQIARERAFSEETGQIMIEMMKGTINTGTASRIRTTYGLKNDIAGKTGTTQNNKDAWFVALTPKLLNITWVGMDNHEIGFKSTSLGQGANAALPIFALWMQKLNADKSFDPITKAKFKPASPIVLEKLDCDPIKRDGFFKRLFKNPDKKKIRDFKSKNAKS